MTDAGLDESDIIVVDRSLDADDGRIAVCFIDGEFTVKRIRRENGIPAGRQRNASECPAPGAAAPETGE